MSLLARIKEHACGSGFDACGAARCRTMEAETAHLERWLDRGLHAGMKYMERYREMRSDPSRLAEGTKSVIVCLAGYKTDRQYPAGIPQIAAYARGADYHHTLKKQLNELLEFIRTLIPGSDGRVFVDSAPVMEKNWAVEAGLGWMGKNSLLIHPELGSFCLIGIILLDKELDEYDEPYSENHCGTCRRCMDHCPAGAIREEGLIDANRCLSYQTIENRESIPDPVIPLLGDRLYGCDTCQEVCPWNTKPAPRNHPAFAPVDGIYEMTAGEWKHLGGGEFRRRFGHTPMARTGLKKLKLTLFQKEGKEG